MYLFTVSSLDYIGIGEKKGTGTVIFPKCSNKTCTSVTIIHDNITETLETFSISVEPKLSNGEGTVIVNSTYGTATIQITPQSQS